MNPLAKYNLSSPSPAAVEETSVREDIFTVKKVRMERSREDHELWHGSTFVSAGLYESPACKIRDYLNRQVDVAEETGLLPCPFCGGDAEADEEDASDIYCSVCNIVLRRTVWNRRYAPTPNGNESSQARGVSEKEKGMCAHCNLAKGHERWCIFNPNEMEEP